MYGIVEILDLFKFAVQLMDGYCLISYHLRPDTYAFSKTKPPKKKFSQ